ncbi:MAG TPA: MarR family winged helix-turn-helix transcriptional regulator [Burkholderiales bacterium]|nr:MarR family winged helix-turn-helix transcriptional regulator [Burkholderiales bacterium]
MPREPRPAFDLERHVFYWITQVIGGRDRMLAQELKGTGLRVPEWRVLAALYARRRCTMSELADIATIDRTTLTRTVDRMQDAGWVARLSDSDDMRITRLALTAAGERMFARIWPAVERLNRASVAGLPPAAVDALRATLKRMKGNLDQGLAGDERAA